MPLVIKNNGILVNGSGLVAKSGPVTQYDGCCCEACERCTTFSGLANRYVLPGTCDAAPYFETTICVPPGCPLPALVTIRGWVDDELIINGAIIEEGEYVIDPSHPFCLYGGFCDCNVAHCVGSGDWTVGGPYFGACDAYSYSFEIEERCFTLAIGDNHGVVAEAYLDICFYDATPFP